ERREVCIKQITIQLPPSGLVSSNRSCKLYEKLNQRTHMAEEKIRTKHPLGKTGRNISRQKYETVRAAILSALNKKQLTHAELFNQLNKSLRGRFSGNVSWYGETVKLDLEARKMIQRTSSKPQKYRLKLN